MPTVAKLPTPARQAVSYAFTRGWLCDQLTPHGYVVCKGGHRTITVPLDLTEDRLAAFKKKFQK